MAMPRNLVLVRHGESEGNLIQRAARNKKKIIVPKKFMERHTCDWRLTDTGIEQAQSAGAWIQENIGQSFDRYYVSNYLRALETAALLGLPDAKWFKSHYICERNWGILDRFLPEQRAKKFAKDFESKRINAFYWSPPRGESMLQLCLRVEKVIETLHRECSGQNVIIVGHGEILWAFRIVLERITLHDYILLDASKRAFDRIRNCQILHYTRINPVTQKQEPYLNWLRSVCPWDMSLSTNKWQQIKRRHYTNQQLLKFVSKMPRLIND